MATRLTKPITRELIRSQATKKGRLCGENEAGRPLLVSLNPDETISFRVKGMRREVACHLLHCYALAQIVSAEADFKAKLETYNIRRKAGLRCRKPKRYNLPYSKIIYKPLK